MTKMKNNHGGKRTPNPGNKLGAPPKRGVAKVPFSGRVTPEVLEFLKSTGNLSEAVEQMTRRGKAFKDWKRSEQNCAD